MTKQNFKQSKNNDKFRGIFPFEFDDKQVEDGLAIPEMIHVLPTGQWEHDLYGPIIINNSDLREFVQNFQAGIRKGVFITAGHEGFDEKPAVGWITELEIRDTGLWGKVAWNSEGKELLSDKAFKFFSPEMCRDYEDPQTHQYYRNVLTGGALTKSPYFKELEAIVFSEPKFKNNNKQSMSKTLEEVLALEVTALSDEDKAVLEENKASLTEEQLAKFFPKVETPAEPAAPETPATPVEEPKKEETPATPETPANPEATETIKASELATLRHQAAKGQEAIDKLEASEVKQTMDSLLFSETNKAGRFSSKSQDKLQAFIKTLNKAQRESFSSLMAETVDSSKFKELGSGDGKDGAQGAIALVETKIQAKIDAEKMSYKDALKAVFSEDPKLAEQYNAEVVGAQK